MTKRTKILSSSLALSVVLALTGCGGSDDGTIAVAQTGTGYYLDSAVAGIDYTCGIQSGTTDAEGAFTFQKGAGCTFTIDGMTVRTIAADQLFNGVKVVEDNTSVAAFLQTLDVDGNPTNGIEITKEVKEALADAGIKALPTDTTAIAEVYNTLKNAVADYNGKEVTLAEAEAHLSETLTSVTKELFADKTLYVVTADTDDHGLTEVSFDASVSTLASIAIEGNLASSDNSVQVQGEKLIWSDGTYSIVTKVTPTYVELTDYDENGKVVGTSKAYYSKTEAETLYKQLFPAVVTPTVVPAVPTTPTTTTTGDKDLLTIEKCEADYPNYTEAQWAEAMLYSGDIAKASACYQALVAAPLAGTDAQLYLDAYNNGTYDVIPTTVTTPTITVPVPTTTTTVTVPSTTTTTANDYMKYSVILLNHDVSKSFYDSLSAAKSGVELVDAGVTCKTYGFSVLESTRIDGTTKTETYVDSVNQRSCADLYFEDQPYISGPYNVAIFSTTAE